MGGSRATRVSRPMAVAGSFYPAGAGQLAATVDELVGAAGVAFPPPAGLDLAGLAGVLVPHAGLVYSGVVAAAAWRTLLPAPVPSGGVPASSRGAPASSRGASASSQGAPAASGGASASSQGAPAASGGASASFAPPTTIVLLGTNHGAGWLNGVGAWDGGPWRTPLGEAEIDRELTEAVLALGAPFAADARCHQGEHSLEVQLPFTRRLAPGARIVALSVGAGTGARAIEAGERLGQLLAARRTVGQDVVIAISSDMAHYPAADVAQRVTATLLPAIVSLDGARIAHAEAATRREPGVSCGMCGIEPTVLGLAALRTMGAAPGVPLAAATSADAGGDPHRTVGYLAVGFTA